MQLIYLLNLVLISSTLYNGKFDCTQNTIETQGKKMIFLTLEKKVKENTCSLNIETTLSLFDTWMYINISSAVNYGCARRGFHKDLKLKNMHIDFLRRIMFFENLPIMLWFT